MRRRDVLKAGVGVICLSGLGGCTSRGSSDSNGETRSGSTPTETATSETTTATPTETPVPFPESCEPLPDIDGLPTPPSQLTKETVKTFVEDFESVYAVATTDEYGGVESLQIDSVEREGERYIVRLSFDAAPATPTPDADGATPTPLPVDAYTHRAVYRLTDDRMLRELRSHIDDSLFSQTCWILDG